MSSAYKSTFEIAQTQAQGFIKRPCFSIHFSGFNHSIHVPIPAVLKRAKSKRTPLEINSTNPEAVDEAVDLYVGDRGGSSASNM